MRRGRRRATTPQRATPPRRYVVLAVDDVHIETSNLLRIKKALNRFLERELEPEDQVAIVTTSGTRGIFQEFTDDRHALQRSVDRLSVQERTVLQTGAPYLTEYQAQEIERGDEDALRVAVRGDQGGGAAPGRGVGGKPGEGSGPRGGRGVHPQLPHRPWRPWTAWCGASPSSRAARSSSSSPTGSWPGSPSRGVGGYDIRRITDAGTRAGVVIYASIPAAWWRRAPGRTASSRMPALTNTFSDRDILNKQSEIATRDAMHALAADSGGFLVQNTNDLTHRASAGS